VNGYVAIVDDDESVRRATARLISAHSFAVRCYASARDFLDSESADPACLILDLRMNGITGLELLHRVNGSGSRFPVIVMTADDEPGVRHRCQLAGASSFLTKPVPADMLLNAINAATAAKNRVATRSKL
jgi:FixJ family two-component response regulator